VSSGLIFQKAQYYSTAWNTAEKHPFPYAGCLQAVRSALHSVQVAFANLKHANQIMRGVSTKAALLLIALVFSSLVLPLANSRADVSFGGTALLNAPGVSAGDVGVLLNDDNGVGFSVLAGNIQAGLSLTSSSTYSGSWGSFSVLGSNTAASVFGNISLAGGATFSLIDGIQANDSFAYLVFSGSTTTTVAGDSVSIWTAPNWLIPADGASLTWPANFTQLTGTSSPALSTAVVSEPSPPPSGSGSFTARAPGGVRFLTATNQTSGVTLTNGATSWASLSDREAKSTPAPLDHRETLRKVDELPVTSWKYEHDSRRRYIGPMAQDFHAIFGLGDDDKYLSTLDLDGVALSALQGLIAELHDRRERSAAQAARLQALEAEFQDLRKGLVTH